MLLRKTFGCDAPRLTLLALATISLTACGTRVCDPGIGALPTLYDYSDETSAKLALEIETAPEGAVWPEIIRDYVQVRDEIRAAAQSE